MATPGVIIATAFTNEDKTPIAELAKTILAVPALIIGDLTETVFWLSISAGASPAAEIVCTVIFAIEYHRLITGLAS